MQIQQKSQTSVSSDKPHNEGFSLEKPQKISKRKSVAQLVKKWTENKEKYSIDSDLLINVFLNDYRKYFSLKITFDNSLSDILADLSKEVDFLQFSNQKENELKSSLKIINTNLRVKNFISERQENKFIDSFLQQNLEDSIYFLIKSLTQQGFIQRKSQRQLDKRESQSSIEDNNTLTNQKLINLWRNSIQISQLNFWSFILKQQLYHRELVPIYKSYKPIIELETSKQFRRSVALYLDSALKQRKQKQQQKRQESLIKVESSVIEYDYLLDQKVEFISAYLQKQRWQKYTQQYEAITNCLKERSSKKNLTFQAYGSFRNKFYILNYSDIDMSLFWEGKSLLERYNVCNLLERIKLALDSDKEQIPNYFYSKTFTFDKIKYPFIKVGFKNDYGKNYDVVPTMDILVNNKEGVENSKLLGMYAQNEYILKFCNMIKYWAYKTSLINLQSKIEGLSSYGLLLMCLYYLMVTKQIPYLRILGQKYDIGEQKFRLNSSLSENFIGFLRFYSISFEGKSEMGRFHKQKRMVCLLQEHCGSQLYDEEMIINMYDFIDNSNPGRMKKYLRSKFDQIFSQTLQHLQNKQLSFINRIFSQGQMQSQTKEMSAPRRGNRLRNIQ